MLRSIALAALALGSSVATAQTRPADSAKPAPTADSAQQLTTEIAKQRALNKNLPDADHFTFGDRTIQANTSVEGPIAVARGNLDVFGTIKGDAFAIDGNIRVHSGALITGDAVAAAGSVIIDGGTIEGTKSAIAVSKPALPVTAPRQPLSTAESAKLVVAWFALFAIIGIGVMIFAEGSLDGVVIALERGLGRSFWIGLAGQVAMLPVLLLLVVGLAITVLGVLLIPFAIVAYVIAVAGLVTLGALAVARLTGGAVASDRGTTSPRGVHLRALFGGLIVYFAIWMVAALFTWNPLIGSILRAVAVCVTWAAATVGLGAALSSRAGTKRPGVGSKSSGGDDLSWQTPTPVTGVAAATRRVAAAK